MHIAKLALAAAACAAASGGIALAAAETGSQPAQPGRVLPTNAASQAQQHAAPALAQHPSGKPAESDPTDATHPTPHGMPSPNLNGLCHAWLAGAGAEHGKARSNPAFSVLVAAAGGSDAVDGYCTTLVGAKTHPSGEDSDDTDSDEPNPAPTHADKSNHPGRTSHPHGRPSDVPPVTPHPHPHPSH